MKVYSFLVLFLLQDIRNVESFVFSNAAIKHSLRADGKTILYGAFNRGNKQADLAKKMALAKQKKMQDSTVNTEEKSSEDIKEQNDRKRFEDLLNSEAATTAGLGGSYLTSSQEEEEITASLNRVERMYEGDPAPDTPFEDLVNVKNDLAIGKRGTDRLLPWLKRSDLKDFIICISDPREKSAELRKLMKTLPASLNSATPGSNVGKKYGEKLIFINADSSPENSRFLKKNEISDVQVYSDEKREWMRAYTALGDKRWSVCMFILAGGKVQKMIRELDPDLADKAVINAIKSYKQ